MFRELEHMSWGHKKGSPLAAEFTKFEIKLQVQPAVGGYVNWALRALLAAGS
jgi:hypothetical protein